MPILSPKWASIARNALHVYGRGGVKFRSKIKSKYSKMIYSSSRFRCNQNQSSTTLRSQIDILAPWDAAAPHAAPEWNFWPNLVSKVAYWAHLPHATAISKSLFPNKNGWSPPLNSNGDTRVSYENRDWYVSSFFQGRLPPASRLVSSPKTTAKLGPLLLLKPEGQVDSVPMPRRMPIIEDVVHLSTLTGSECGYPANCSQF